MNGRLTSGDDRVGGKLMNARRTHPELIEPAPGEPRRKGDGRIPLARETPCTTPTDRSRRDSAVPILSRPGADVRASADRDRPAPTPELRREQLLRELDAYHALPASYRSKLERRMGCTASAPAAERRRRAIRDQAVLLLIARFPHDYAELIGQASSNAGGRA